MTAQKRLWLIEAVDLGQQTLTVCGVNFNQEHPDEKPTIYQVRPSTRVWKGTGFGVLSDLETGQTVLLNLTVCTLKGPGRCTDIWLNEESRQVAIDHQLAVHRVYAREHGLAGWVDEVDNQNRIVSITFFAGFDSTLKAEFHKDHYVAISVAESNLGTHDQINDSARGPIVEVQESEPTPGNSGLRVRIQPSLLLEGFRPKRYVRVFGNGWPIDDLPREERMYDG